MNMLDRKGRIDLILSLSVRPAAMPQINQRRYKGGWVKLADKSLHHRQLLSKRVYWRNVPVSECGKGGDAEIIEGPDQFYVANPWCIVRKVKGTRDQELGQKIAQSEYYSD